MNPMEHIWTIVMLEICKHTFYAYLSRIWKMMQFTRFIRKVFATTILLSGKFSLFLTLHITLIMCITVHQCLEEGSSSLCMYVDCRALHAVSLYTDHVPYFGDITMHCSTEMSWGIVIKCDQITLYDHVLKTKVSISLTNVTNVDNITKLCIFVHHYC